MGAAEESRTVVVPAYRHFVESPDYALQHVSVRLVMQQQQPPPLTFVSQHQQMMLPAAVEVVAGELRVGIELNYFQNMLI